jgi:hypothetical protein
VWKTPGEMALTLNAVHVPSRESLERVALA